MIIRKQGETNGQFVKRHQAYAETLKLKIINLSERINQILQVSETVNPRTQKNYKEEAQQMFTTVALVEHALRVDELDFAKAMCQQQLEELGFDTVQIYQNEALQEGAYSGKKES